MHRIDTRVISTYCTSRYAEYEAIDFIGDAAHVSEKREKKSQGKGKKWVIKTKEGWLLVLLVLLVSLTFPPNTDIVLYLLFLFLFACYATVHLILSFRLSVGTFSAYFFCYFISPKRIPFYPILIN